MRDLAQAHLAGRTVDPSADLTLAFLLLALAALCFAALLGPLGRLPGLTLATLPLLGLLTVPFGHQTPLFDALE